MADEVHELAVAIRPEGAEETTDALDDVSDSFDETADDVGESAGLMSDFSRKFKGAGLVFAGVFGSLVGAIASKMPIISETFVALDTLLTSIGLRMDQFARGPMSRLNMKIFELADAIATPGRELEALQISLGVAVDGLRKMPAAMPFVALAALADEFFNVRDSVSTLVDFFTGPFATALLGEGSVFARLKSTVAGLPSALGSKFQSAKETIFSTFITPVIDGLKRLLGLMGQATGGVASGGEGRRQFRESDPALTQPGGSNGPRFPGAPRGIVADPAGTTVSVNVDTSTQLDSQTIGESTKSVTIAGALNSGRASRL